MSSSTMPLWLSQAASLEYLKPYGFLVATLVLGSYLLYQWALPKPIPGIPYNVESSRKLLGDIPDLLKETTGTDKTFMNFIRQRVERHNSPVIQVFVRPFGKPLVILSDFRESQDILLRRKEFERSKFMEDLFQGIAPEHHIMKMTDDIWKAHRRLLQDLMSPPFLNHVAAPVVHSNMQNLIKLWDLKADIVGKRPFDATEDIYSAALDAVFGFAFGQDFEYSATGPNVVLLEGLSTEQIAELRGRGNTNDDQPVKFPEAAKDDPVTATLDLALALEEINGKPLSKYLWRWVTARKERTKRALKLRDDYIYSELKKAVQRMESHDLSVKSAVDHMVQRETKLAEKDGRAPEYLSPVMADETFGFVIAGHETTSTTVLWGLKMLADNPQPQQKLRQLLQASHADATGARRSPTVDEITGANIPYLDAVMEEILRCAGTVPAVDRQALCDTDVLGYRIPKGVSVVMSGMGPSLLSPGFDIDEEKRSQTCQAAKSDGRFKAWDPDDIGMFKPERWLVDNGQFDSTAGPQLAFGLGTRGCYGRRLAYLELRILLTMIVWNFELLRCPEELSGYAAVSGVTSKPRKCFVRLRKVW